MSPVATPPPNAAATSVEAHGSAGAVVARQIEAQPNEALLRYTSFETIVELIRANRDVKLLVEVETTLRLVSYAPGRIAFAPTEAAPADLAQRLGNRLSQWTGVRWAISVEAESDAPTIAETRDAKARELEEEARAHPMVQAVLTAFPSAKITEIRTHAALEAEAAESALPEVEGEWDPFEED